MIQFQGHSNDAFPFVDERNLNDLKAPLENTNAHVFFLSMDGSARCSGIANYQIRQVRWTKVNVIHRGRFLPTNLP